MAGASRTTSPRNPYSRPPSLHPWGPSDSAKDVSVAEQQLDTQGGRAFGPSGVNDLDQQVWWARMWRDPESPYRIVPVNPEGRKSSPNGFSPRSDPRCFPGTDPEDIPDRPDAKIVAESLVLGATMLLTSNLRSIDHIEVNKWTIKHGAEWGIRPERLLHEADDAFVRWTVEDAALERWIQAGFIACWPSRDDADPVEVIDRTAAGIEALSRGTGGKLPRAAARLLNGLEKTSGPDRARREDPEDLCRARRWTATGSTRRTPCTGPVHPPVARSCRSSPHRSPLITTWLFPVPRGSSSWSGSLRGLGARAGSPER